LTNFYLYFETDGVHVNAIPKNCESIRVIDAAAWL